MSEEIVNKTLSFDEDSSQYLKKRWKKKISKVGWALFWFQFIIQIMGIFLIYPLSSLLSYLSIPDELINWILSISMIYLLGFPVFFLIVHSMPDFKIEKEEKLLNLRKIMVYWILCLGILYGFNLFGLSISIFITSMTGGNPNPIGTMIGNPVYTLLFGCIIPAILEELIFRKLLIQKLYPLGDTFCILLSGVLFGFFHGNLAQIVYAIPLGCFLAYVYIKTNDIRNAMLLHFLTNLCGTILIPTLSSYAIIPVVIFILFILIFSIVYMIKHRHSIELNNGTMPISEKEKRALFFKSAGFISYAFLTLILVIITLVLPSVM